MRNKLLYLNRSSFSKTQSPKIISSDDYAVKILLVEKRDTFGQLILFDLTFITIAFHSDTENLSSHIRGKEDLPFCSRAVGIAGYYRK